MKITKIRNKLGLTMKEVADNIGMSERNWRRVEIGEHSLKLKYAHQLWAYLVKSGLDPKTNILDLFK